MDYLENLYAASDNFQTPHVDHNPSLSNLYTLDQIHTALRNAAKSRNLGDFQNIRLYVENHRLSNFELQNILSKISSYDYYEDIEWTSIFQSKEFIFFINNAALYNDEISQSTAKITKSLLGLFDKSEIAIEHHIIIGRYTKTPFGIHIDDPHDRVLHYNLGPGPKSLMLWPRLEYLKTNPKEAVMPTDRLPPGGSEYRFNSGAAFLLPSNYYHIGSTNGGVNTTLALALTKLSVLQLTSNLSKNIYQFLGLESDPNAGFTDFHSTCVITKLENRLKKDHGQILQNCFKDLVARSASNCGISEKARPRNTFRQTTDPIAEISRDFDIIKAKIDGAIFYYFRANRCQVTDQALEIEIDRAIARGYFDMKTDMGELLAGINAFKAWLSCLNGIKTNGEK